MMILHPVCGLIVVCPSCRSLMATGRKDLIVVFCCTPGWSQSMTEGALTGGQCGMQGDREELRCVYCQIDL